ncbi:BQ5605_C003g02020 [Microbotryum silenes-dioicae]|uniref:BQ5605_C003g02020 protein n=1 Tax=Microbotryum silenes-dioicae TaxID=796604 RepID=A0A2X0P338_9BASI|nr:BQ5605_C003g02020 [Microbotryum silenes-dioicae]
MDGERRREKSSTAKLKRDRKRKWRLTALTSISELEARAYIWAYTALSTFITSFCGCVHCRDRCVPHSQDYLPVDEVADREFHLAGRSQLLAARYETLDVARLE